MKKTFKQILEDTFFKDQDNWNYYSGCEFTEFPLNSEEESKQFIESFIKLSGKAKNSLYCQIDKLGSRAVHVVSAFLLGHYLYHNTILQSKIDNEIKELLSDLDIKSEDNFSFMWFLICLFHDIGFNMETNQLKYDSVDDLLKDGKMPDEVVGIPKFYNTIYKNYFKYRRNEHCKNDHGIMVAYIMYKELCEIREKAEGYPKDEQGKLCWKKDLEKIFAFCAWNVLAHNIWFGDKEKTCDDIIYKKYKMRNLLLDKNEYKIKMDEYPFFFLFCLVDTIEPYKRVLNIDLLNKLELEILNDRIIITSNLKCACGKAVLKQANDLKGWLTHTKDNSNSVEISLNQTQYETNN